MKNFYTSVYGLFCVIAAVLGKFLGGWNAPLEMVCVMMICDYFAGLIVAGVFKNSPKTDNGRLSSRAGIKGIFTKLSMLVIIALASTLDKVTGQSVFRSMTILFFAGNEGVSLLENFGLMGAKYPPALYNALEVLKNKGEETK